MDKKVCIDKGYFIVSSISILIITIVSILFGYYYYINRKIIVNNIRPVIIKQPEVNTTAKFLNKIQNPLEPPNMTNPSGSFNERGYNANVEYQNIGFITGENQQYPVYGRYYNNNSNLWEYYTINEGRNMVKIPIKNINHKEIYTGDSVQVPELGNIDFKFVKYETDGNKYMYNP